MLDKILPVFIAFSGAFCIFFGAWLAHGADFLQAEQLSSLSIALNYQFIHTLALLSMYVWYTLAPQKPITYTLTLFMLGILLFSGSIYLKALTGIPLVGKLTPLGGVMLASGWLSLILLRKKS